MFKYKAVILNYNNILQLFLLQVKVQTLVIFKKHMTFTFLINAAHQRIDLKITLTPHFEWTVNY